MKSDVIVIEVDSINCDEIIPASNSNKLEIEEEHKRVKDCDCCMIRPIDNFYKRCKCSFDLCEDCFIRITDRQFPNFHCTVCKTSIIWTCSSSIIFIGENNQEDISLRNSIDRIARNNSILLMKITIAIRFLISSFHTFTYSYLLIILPKVLSGDYNFYDFYFILFTILGFLSDISILFSKRNNPFMEFWSRTAMNLCYFLIILLLPKEIGFYMFSILLSFLISSNYIYFSCVDCIYLMNENED